MEAQLKFPADRNILDLPGSVMLEVRDALDTRMIDNVSAWRVFAARLSGRFAYQGKDVERLSLQLHKGGSPSSLMMQEVGNKAMVTRDLVKALDDLKLEDVLTRLVKDDDVKITSQPEAFVKVKEGQQISISTEATGFPYPRYLWYRSDPKTEDSVATTFTQSTLKISSARVEDSGDYCCLVYNCPEKGVFTNWCCITVQSVTPTENPPYLPIPPQGTGISDSVPTLPVILKQPWPVNVSLDEPFHLLCEARGHLPLSYQWLRNEQPIASSQTGFLKVNQSTLEDDGVYQCIVSNQYGSVSSSSVKVCVAANEWATFTTAPLIPEIQKHPKSCEVQLEGDAIFRCIAHGMGNLQYQWFKDCDSIPGATENEYHVYNVNKREMQGVYMCLVSNHHGQVLSKGAVLQIGDITYKPNFFATDKIALLIGNYDYRSQLPLKAPQTDIQNLSHIFQRFLGFKVVSLLNLTLVEMTSAVDEFCQMIDSGVYCVFYFCGHGFEDNNHSYILPNDVPTDYKTEECLSAEYVLSQMQQRRPKVCCMILDICRKPAENPSLTPRRAVMECPPVKDGNTIVCYATSCGLSAYEIIVRKETRPPPRLARNRNSSGDNAQDWSCGLAAFEFLPQSKGILVTHLEKLLPEPISIEAVFRKVKEAVGSDSRVNRDARTRQIPEVRSNLIEGQRSFTDPVETSGHTRACNERQLAWENAHVKPPPMEVCLNPVDLGVVVELTFQHEFSNVLSVFVKVIRNGGLLDCIAWISKLPSSVSMMKKPTCVTPQGSEFTVTKNIIIDIQKLKENLQVSLAMRYRLPGSQTYICSKDTRIDLQLPLVAGLHLWRERPSKVTSSRHAVEQTEDDKPDS